MSKRRARRSSPAPLQPIAASHRQAFALAFLANGGNATAAYAVTFPRSSRTSSAASANRLLKDPDVIAIIAAERTARFARLKMDADEALALISGDARADIRRLYDAKGKLLPVNKWPASIALSVSSISETPLGVRITLNNALRARELMAQAGGKLKNTVTIAFDHEAYLASKSPV